MNIENKITRLANSKKLRSLLKEKSLHARAACIIILRFMTRNRIEALQLDEFLSQNNDLTKEIFPIKNELPSSFSLKDLDLTDNYIELTHAEIALKREAAPVPKLTPAGIDSYLYENKSLKIKTAAVVSDDPLFSETLSEITEETVHYLRSKSDESYKCRKLLVLGMKMQAPSSHKLDSMRISLGDDFLNEQEKKYSMIVITQSDKDDSAYIEKARKLLTDDGIVVYCVSPKFLTSAEYSDARKKYLAEKAIRTVFELKNNNLSPVFAALEISDKPNESIKFSSVENLIPSYRRPENGNSSSVEINYSVINESGTDFLSSDYYINNNPLIRKSGKNYVSFEDAIELGRGCYTPISKLKDRLTSEKTEYKYLTVSDIENGKIKENISYLTEISDLEKKYLVTKGDFVLSKTANPIKFAEITGSDQFLASVNLYILRLKEGVILPEYLKNYFESKEGLQQLRSIVRGDNGITMLGVKELKSLMIPCPDLDEQKRLVTVTEYQKLEAEEKLLEEKLNELRKKKKLLLSAMNEK